MERVFAVNLKGKTYSCKHCGTHLPLTDDIVSKEGLKPGVSMKCADCQGFGMKDRCPQCKGKKVMQEKKVFEVVVENGMQHGQKITFLGEADEA
ncbi:hypothetical protein C2S52_016284, partial [Perilla frutescens var. hirtella]